MAKAVPTHKVIHPKLYLSIGGKIQKMKVGTPLAMSEKQAARYGNKVEKIVTIPTLEVATPAPAV